MESATQTLHRLTSVERYDEAREIEPPVDAPGVVQGFTPMDLSRLPWFYKRYHDGLHLAAYALGVAASGMTFVDGLVPRLLGQPNMQGLLFTCIGVPEYAPKPGGLPGNPSTVQMVTPRF